MRASPLRGGLYFPGSGAEPAGGAALRIYYQVHITSTQQACFQPLRAPEQKNGTCRVTTPQREIWHHNGGGGGATPLKLILRAGPSPDKKHCTSADYLRPAGGELLCMHTAFFGYRHLRVQATLVACLCTFFTILALQLCVWNFFYERKDVHTQKNNVVYSSGGDDD